MTTRAVRRYDESLTAVLLRGSYRSELDLAAEAALFAQGTHRGLVALLVRPLVWRSLVAVCGVDPERLRREIEMEQRQAVRKIFAAVGAKDDYAIAMIGRPTMRSAVRVARERGCARIVVRESGLGPVRRRRSPRRGIQVITVPARPGRDPDLPLGSAGL